MFITLRRGETRQTFNVWVYGDEKLARGSGLFVGESGVACNHHFLLPEDGTGFPFLAGEYQVDAFASLVGSAKVLHLCSVPLAISERAAVALQEPECGIYFDWGPDSQRYHAHVEKKEFKHPYEKMLDFIANKTDTTTPAPDNAAPPSRTD